MLMPAEDLRNKFFTVLKKETEEMKTKKIIALLLALVMTASFAVSAFAASGEGYFGSDAAEDVITDTDDDYYDEYENVDDTDGEYEPIPNDIEDIDEPGNDNPVLPPMDDEDEYNQPATAPVTSVPTRTTKAVADKREKQSEDTAKVINSYGLSKAAAKSLIARHKDAEKGMGNREKASRYSKILKANPNDYLAAYRLAQVNAAMGRNGQALGWVNRCLKIYPNYMPARRLRTKLGGK